MGKKTDTLAEFCRTVAEMSKACVVLAEDRESERLLNAHIDGVGKFAHLLACTIEDNMVDEICDEEGAFIMVRTILATFSKSLREGEDAE